MPPLKDDVQLAVKPGDGLTTLFRAALVELIRELKQKNKGTQQFTLENGKRLSAELRGYSYQFEFTEEANLFESAKVEVLIGGKRIAGQITGILQGQIIVTIEDDFGPVIRHCVLRIDNTALLQALHDRLQQIDTGDAPSFRIDFATKVVRNEGAVRQSASAPKWPWGENPNHEQEAFVRMALENEITWLWGPPGTGKTDVLAAFTRIQFDLGKRVLVCSNTNQAVDQLLLKLCQKMEGKDTTLEDGRVLRLGRIEHDELKKFKDRISVGGIVERRSRELAGRRQVIHEESARVAEMCARARAILARFQSLDSLRKDLAGTDLVLQENAASKRDALAASRTAGLNERRFKDEIQELQSAGALRRFFMRGEKAIQRDLTAATSTFLVAQRRLESADAQLATVLGARDRTRKAFTELERSLEQDDRSQLQRIAADAEARGELLRRELARIDDALEKVRASIVSEARIIGATATRTFLRPIEFASFDTVIIDEASMILLPAVFHVADLATERVIIAGDPRQLPPIVQTEQRAIFEALGVDIFTGAKIDTAAEDSNNRVVRLCEQFRMDETICRLVSDTFYGGRIWTSARRSAKQSRLPSPFSNRLTLIDTSSVSPFTTRNAFGSHLNLMHAIVIRNLLFHLQQHNCLQTDDRTMSALGVCSPYAAQTKLLSAVSVGYGWSTFLRTSTVHGFQGDERETVVVDLVDSVGESRAGLFLQANNWCMSGANLLNVAFSRAKENLIVVGNLHFLDLKLPGDAFLRRFLHEMQGNGNTIDARDVLAMYPIDDDLERLGAQPPLDPETSRTGLFGEKDFWNICPVDLAAAQKSIVIFSGFITQSRTADIGDSLRARIRAGVKVRCVTRGPAYNGGIPVEQGRSALQSLETIGVAIDLRQDIHEKVVVIDGRIVWFGSLNPLSHSSKTSEIMGRVENAAFARQVAQLLSLRPNSSLDEHGESFAEAENPRCAVCGGWSIAMRGKFGRFFSCEAERHWTENVDRPRRGTRKKTS